MIRQASVGDATQLSEWVRRDFDENTDFGPFLANPFNVALICGDGCACFVWHGPGIFEVHIGLAQRGAEAIRVMRTVLETMRRDYQAKLFWAGIPIENRRAAIFARLMGWKSNGLAELPHGWCELFTGE